MTAKTEIGGAERSITLDRAIRHGTFILITLATLYGRYIAHVKGDTMDAESGPMTEHPLRTARPVESA